MLFYLFFTVLPGKVDDIEAELNGPSAINVSWKKPEEGGPVDGYKILYWDKPESVKTAEVEKEVSFYKIFFSNFCPFFFFTFP